MIIRVIRTDGDKYVVIVPIGYPHSAVSIDRIAKAVGQTDPAEWMLVDAEDNYWEVEF